MIKVSDTTLLHGMLVLYHSLIILYTNLSIIQVQKHFMKALQGNCPHFFARFRGRKSSTSSSTHLTQAIHQGNAIPIPCKDIKSQKRSPSHPTVKNCLLWACDSLSSVKDRWNWVESNSNTDGSHAICIWYNPISIYLNDGNKLYKIIIRYQLLDLL